MSLLVTNAWPETTRTPSLRAYAAEVELIQNCSLFQQEYSHRPSLISVQINKPFSDSNLGIEFKSVLGALVIESIAPGSPLLSSPLRIGDRLIHLDQNPNVTHWTAIQAERYIRGKQGKISFIFHAKRGDPSIVEAVVYRSNMQEKLGITFQREEGRLKICNIWDTGLQGNASVLCPGDFVVSINGIDVKGLDSSLASDILDFATGSMITLRTSTDQPTEESVRATLEEIASSMMFTVSEDIVATSGETKRWDPESVLTVTKRDDSSFRIRPGFISVKVYKPVMETDLEFSFVDGVGGQLQIGSVSKHGILRHSPLVPGLIVQSIGHIRCNRWSQHQALEMVRTVVGELLLILQDPMGDNSHALAMVYKPTPRSKIGLQYKFSADRLRIGGVTSNGLFWDSLLNTEDIVVAINSVPCQHLTPSEAVAITRQIPDTVMVLVKLHRTNCIVLSHDSDDTRLLMNELMGFDHGYEQDGGCGVEGQKETSRSCGDCLATVAAKIYEWSL